MDLQVHVHYAIRQTKMCAQMKLNCAQKETYNNKLLHYTDTLIFDI